MHNIHTIFFASSNREKVREASAILSPLDIDLLTPEDMKGFVPPEETGSTFLENARIKAREGFRVSGKPTFAEDAGLEVAELDGEPGVFSSRYKGDIPQKEKNMDIIRRLDSLPRAERRARFHAVIVFYCGETGSPLEIVAEGLCYGRISRSPVGTNGFGYDPIFTVPELSRTFGELPADVKNRISHRRNALEVLKQRLALLANLQGAET